MVTVMWGTHYFAVVIIGNNSPLWQYSLMEKY